MNPSFPNGVEILVSLPNESPNPRRWADTPVGPIDAPVARFGFNSATAGPALTPALKRLASPPTEAVAMGV